MKSLYIGGLRRLGSLLPVARRFGVNCGVCLAQCVRGCGSGLATLSRGYLSLSVLSLTALSLTGCLPDGNTVREKTLSQFVAGQASAYADGLITYSVQGQSALAAAFAGGVLPAPGPQGRSADGRMAYAYCVEGTGLDANHMVLTWYRMAADGVFVVKGIGEGAGPGIVQSFASRLPPEAVGVMQSGIVALRGPRKSGSTRLDLTSLTGCATVSIPEGAPVILAEHLKAPLVEKIETALYDYRTVSCPDDGDIGSIVQRCFKAGDSDCPKSVPANSSFWSDYSSTCHGAVSTRAIRIDTRTDGSRLVGALDLANAAELQDSLTALAETRGCRGSSPTKLDEDGDEVADEDSEDSFDTCDEGIDVEAYTGPGDNRLGDIIDKQVLTLACGAGRVGVVAQIDPDNTVDYQGYGGNWDLNGGWSGTVTYERYLYNADTSNAEPGAEGNSARWSDWVGVELDCARDEELVVSCEDVFSDQIWWRGGHRWENIPLANGGYRYKRRNRVTGWQDGEAFVPNAQDPAPWAFVSVDCSMRLRHRFDVCPDDMTRTKWGYMNKTYTAVGNIGEYEETPWISEQANRCEKRDAETVSCSQPVGYGYTWIMAWDQLPDWYRTWLTANGYAWPRAE